MKLFHELGIFSFTNSNKFVLCIILYYPFHSSEFSEFSLGHINLQIFGSQIELHLSIMIQKEVLVFAGLDLVTLLFDHLHFRKHWELDFLLLHFHYYNSFFCLLLLHLHWHLLIHTYFELAL